MAVLIATHRLTAEAFAELAHGDGDTAVVRYLRGAQRSKHLMLLHAVAEAADKNADPASPGVIAFRAGFKLLAAAQAADPDVVASLLALPHLGGWTYDCVARLEQGLVPDFGYLAWVAATAAIQAGLRFELEVSVRDGRVLFPGLGWLTIAGERSWIRLRSDGERLAVGDLIDLPCAALVPDDGSAEPVPRWRGIPRIRAMAEGHAWDVLLETADPHLDRFNFPISAELSATGLAAWRECVRSAWRVLVRHHDWISGQVAEGVSVIVPLVQDGDADPVSETTAAAFGAIAMSWPADPVSLAETLVHEFAHLKLSALQDIVPLTEVGGDKEGTYAPWREDPRPGDGLLQGVYAHLGIVRFWDTQRQAETEPDGLLRAQARYERWRPAIEPAARTLLQAGRLTPAGIRFVTALGDRGRSLESESVPADARDIATEAALDHWLTWQLRHTAVDPAGVASLAAAYRRDEPLRDEMLPPTWVEEYTRKIGSTARSRALDMRYRDPQRFCRLRTTGLPGLSDADLLLIDGRASEAAEAYRDEIAAVLDPIPESWIGLGLAIGRLPTAPARQVFATRLPLVVALHECLAGQGVRSDPMDLAAWFA